MCRASISRNCVQSHLICNGHLTLLIITYHPWLPLLHKRTLVSPFRRWICKDTLIRVRCKCKRDICQGGVVGYPRGLWILRPGFESRPWPFLFSVFFSHFHPAHPLCFSLHISSFELENYHGQYYTHSRSENEYTIHEPYPD